MVDHQGMKGRILILLSEVLIRAICASLSCFLPFGFVFWDLGYSVRERQVQRRCASRRLALRARQERAGRCCGRRLRLRAAAAGAWRRSLGSVCGGQRPSRACACVPGRAARVPSGPARDSPGRGDSTSWSATTQPRWLEPTRSNSLYRPAGRQPSESL